MRKEGMNMYYEELLAEGGHSSINEYLETMDVREGKAYREELENQLAEIEALEK